jgi:hypothetical protein
MWLLALSSRCQLLYFKILHVPCKVGRSHLANWRWKWVIALDNRFLDLFDAYGEEWQFAQIELNSPLQNLTLLAPNDRPSEKECCSGHLNDPSLKQRSVHLHSLLPRHTPERRGITRAVQYLASIDTVNDILLVGQSVYKISDLTMSANKTLLHFVTQDLQQSLFPAALVTHGNLRQRRMLATVNLNPPFVVVKSKACQLDPTQQCEVESGIDYNLARVLRDSLNFT